MRKVLFMLLLATPLVALDQPCANYIWNDDPTYVVSGHVDSVSRTQQTYYENPLTYIKFSDGREACFTERLSPDAVKLGQDAIFTYQRHCAHSCYTFVKSEVKK
jgi:hypothetical protein